MIAKRNNQLEREGKGGTKERTAGVEHTWKPGVVEAKGAISNPLCQPSRNYYQILVEEPPPHPEQPTPEPCVAAQTAKRIALSVEQRAAKRLTRPPEVSAYTATKTQLVTSAGRGRCNIRFAGRGVHHPTQEKTARPLEEWRLPP